MRSKFCQSDFVGIAGMRGSRFVLKSVIATPFHYASGSHHT